MDTGTVKGVVHEMGIAQDEGEVWRVVDHARAISSVRRMASHVTIEDADRP